MKGFPEIDGYELRQCLARSGGEAWYRAEQTRLARNVLVGVFFGRHWETPEEVLGALERSRTTLFPEVIDLMELPSGGRCLVVEDAGVQPLLPLLRGGHLEAQQTVALGMQLAEGFEALSREHLMVGALTPEQLYINEQSEPVLLCFSSLGFWDGAGEPPEPPQEEALRFAAPEVLQGEPFDVRAEVWSVALVLYAVLSGQRPFGAIDTAELTEAQETLCLPSPCDVHAHIPEALGKVLQWMTAREPESRPAAWDEIRLALYRAGQGFVSDGLTIEDSVIAAPTPHKQYYGGNTIRLSAQTLRRYHQNYEAQQAARKSNCLWMTLILFLVLAVLSGAAWVVLHARFF